MSTASQTKHTRSEQARINGAKSHGPKTAAGKLRAQSAPLQHGFYATDPTLQPTIDPALYAQLRAQYQAVWAPANIYIADKVDDLVAARAEVLRLREVRRQFLLRVFKDVESTYNPMTAELSVIAETEIRAAAAGGTLDRLDHRLRRHGLEISRIERGIFHAMREMPASGGSQMLLETKEAEPKEIPVEWARRTCNLAPSPSQTGILNTASQTTVLAAGRHTGKTTALALRALHEAAHNPEAVVACLSPNGDLLAKVEQLAAQANVPTEQISGQLTTAATLVLIDDAAELVTAPQLPQGAQLIMASTPKGASGYFYKQWMNPHAAKLFAPTGGCDFASREQLEEAREKLTTKEFREQYHAEFL